MFKVWVSILILINGNFDTDQLKPRLKKFHLHAVSAYGGSSSTRFNLRKTLCTLLSWLQSLTHHRWRRIRMELGLWMSIVLLGRQSSEESHWRSEHGLVLSRPWRITYLTLRLFSSQVIGCTQGRLFWSSYRIFFDCILVLWYRTRQSIGECGCRGDQRQVPSADYRSSPVKPGSPHAQDDPSRIPAMKPEGVALTGREQPPRGAPVHKSPATRGSVDFAMTKLKKLSLEHVRGQSSSENYEVTLEAGSSTLRPLTGYGVRNIFVVWNHKLEAQTFNSCWNFKTYIIWETDLCQSFEIWYCVVPIESEWHIYIRCVAQSGAWINALRHSLRPAPSTSTLNFKFPYVANLDLSHQERLASKSQCAAFTNAARFTGIQPFRWFHLQVDISKYPKQDPQVCNSDNDTSKLRTEASNDKFARRSAW